MQIKLAQMFDTTIDALLGQQSKEKLDLKHLLKSGSMTYGGEEISEHNLRVLTKVVQSFLDEVDDE